MPFSGGVLAAAKMLAGLELEERERVLETIAKKDAQMAELIKKNMVLFDDLQYLTIKMLQEFLREIDLNDLALALRKGSKDLKEFFLKNISSGMRREIEDIVNGPPCSANLVNDAEDKIMTKVRSMIDEGKLILNSDGKDEYV